jgi:hypothetical protein
MHVCKNSTVSMLAQSKIPPEKTQNTPLDRFHLKKRNKREAKTSNNKPVYVGCYNF